MLKEILRNGDILLVHTNGFSPISWAIRELTQSAWNHVGSYVEDIDRQGFVIEALGNGVVKTPIEKYEGNKNYILKVVRIKIEAFKTKKEYDDGITEATENMGALVGTKYDWWAIVYLGFAYILKGAYKKGRKYIPVGNPLQARNKFFCSEAVCQACYNISSLFPYLFQGNTLQKCDTTTPRDIAKSKNVETMFGKNDVN